MITSGTVGMYSFTMVQRVGDETTGDHSHALVDPGTEKYQYAGNDQYAFTFSRNGVYQKYNSDYHHDHGSPHPGYICPMPMKPHKQIFDMIHMLGNIAVKCDKYFTEKKENIQTNGVGNNFGQRLNLLFSRIEGGQFPNDHAQHNKQGRTGGKGRCQEKRGARMAVSQKPLPGRPQNR